MTRLLLCIALSTLLAHVAGAMEDFSRKPLRLAMFGLQEESAEAPPRGQAFPGDRTGLYSLGFWLTPNTRFTSDPTGIGVGFGGEGSYSLSDRLSFMATFGIWDMRVQSKKPDGEYARRGALLFELETGPRVRMRVWPHGSLYGDMRFGLTIAGGRAPVRSTTSIGAGAYFGFEFGGDLTRLYLELGLAWRGALNRTDSGWLDVDNRNGPGGTTFELVRVGLRVYF